MSTSTMTAQGPGPGTMEANSASLQQQQQQQDQLGPMNYGMDGGMSGGMANGGMGQQQQGAMMGGPPYGQQQQQQQQQQQMPMQQQQKTAYAKKVKSGEKPANQQPPPGVQSGSAPVETTGDYQAVNTGLEGDAPRMASFYRDTSRFYASLDHGSFAEDVQRRNVRGGWAGWSARGPMLGSMTGSMMGSMMGGPMAGSMYGGNLMMGSMYGGCNPMMGSMYMPGSMYANGYPSRPASLFGSMYGAGGSMYGGNPQMGSMMMGPMMGSMGPGGYGMNPGSMYGMQGAGSAYMGGAGQGQQTSMYNVPGGNQSGYQQQQPTSFYGQDDPKQQQQPGGNMITTGPTGAGANGEAGVAVTPAAGKRAAAVAGGGSGDSKNVPIPAHVLLLDVPADPAAAASTALRADPSNPNSLLLGAQSRQVLVDQLSTGAQPQEVIASWRQGQHFHTLIEHTAAGHNTAVIATSDASTPGRACAAQVVEAVLTNAVARVRASAEADGPAGYADAQLFCFSFKSATEARNLAEGPAAAYRPPEIGSHPLFGPGFMNAQSIPVDIMSGAGTSAITSMLHSIKTQTRAQDSVQVLQLVLKQQRSSGTTGQPDVLVSSVLAVLSNAQEGGPAGTPFFGVVRSEAVVPTALLRSAVGGACCTMAVLSLSATATTAETATAALSSLMDVHASANPPPRSGSLVRFVTFAQSESEKLSKRTDASPSVLQKVSTMLKDGQALMANPRGVQPRPYPITHSSSNNANTPSTAMAQGAGGPAATPSATVGMRSLPAGAGPGAAASSSCASAAAASAGAHGDDGKADENNFIRTTLIVGAVNGAAETLRVQPDGVTVTDTATGQTAVVNEVVRRAAEDWRTTNSVQANEVQLMFQNGNNTAVVGTVSPTEVNMLDKQPLWLSYKRMVSSLLSVASQKYGFAEVSLSVSLLQGNNLVADLLANLDGDPAKAAPAVPKKLSVAFSPLFGPTVHRATIVKPPTPLQLESTINSALYQVPALTEQCAGGGPCVIFASAVLKSVTDDDVFTCSLVGASTTDPDVFADVLEHKDTAPHELFEYAFGGPCSTLFLGDVNQGDNNVAAVLQLLNSISTRRNRTVRACSVKRFVAFAEDNLKKLDEKLTTAKTDRERETIRKGKKSMEVFYTEYTALLNDPEHRDPKTYRKGGSSRSGGDDTTSIGSRGSRTSSTAAAAVAAAKPGRSSDRTSKDDTTSRGSRSSRPSSRAANDGGSKLRSSSSAARGDASSKDDKRKPPSSSSSSGKNDKGDSSKHRPSSCSSTDGSGKDAKKKSSSSSSGPAPKRSSSSSKKSDSKKK